MSMLQPEFKPLIEILDHKLFRIPEYQRHYSWLTKQRNDLFDDIKNLQEKRKKYDDRMHFMATLVCLKTGIKESVGSSSFNIFDVVDGQQRITTLVILLKAISKRLKQENQLSEASEIDKLLVKDDRRLIILRNNHDNCQFLRKYLVDGDHPSKDSIKTLADQNLAQAIKECEKFVNSNSDAISLLALIKNHLFFVFQSLGDKGAVYTIFEVLNSRGLDVDWLDKCKSLLMGLLYDFSSSLNEDSPSIFEQHLNELHEYWSDIYKEIGLQNIPGHEIVQFAATLQNERDSGRPLNADESLEHFKEICTKPIDNNDRIDKVINSTIWLKNITYCLSKLYADRKRNAVTGITQARLLAVAIMVRNYYSHIDDVEKELLLDQWERTSFKIYGLFGKDSRTKRGDFVRAAKKMVRAKRGTRLDDLVQYIADIGNEFNIENAVAELMKGDFYNGWQKELRYFLFKYEEYLSAKNGVQLNEVIWNEIWESNLNNTIEHILPQDISNPGWKHISKGDYSELINSIGNLSILSPRLNGEASNKSFANKKKVYKKSGLILFDNVIYNKDVERNIWGESAINERSRRLIEFAKEQWGDV